MPTAAKLAALILFGLLGAGLAAYVSTLLPPEMPDDLLLPVVAGLSAVSGWRISGAAAGRGERLSEAAATGIRTAVTALFFSLMGFAVAEMIRQAFRRVYDGPMEAVVAVFEEMVELLPLLADAGFVAAFVAGAVVAGILTGMVGRRWT